MTLVKYLFKIQDPNWISGFVDAEGCFLVRLSSTLTYASLVFQVAQHIRDAKLLKELINYFNCGHYRLSSKMAGVYIVTKFVDINTIILPFFNKYPLQGVKSKDFADFCKAVDIVSNKAHLSKEGLDQIRIIKNRMNTNRKE